MNYLTRQIFPFTPSWADAVARSITFDQQSTLLGFGAEYFTPTAQYTVNGWEFSVRLENGAALLAFEAFADSLVGRLQGFWLACPLQAAVLSAGVSTTQFDIVAEDLASSWNSRPDQHLLFTFPNGTQAAAQIQGVVANGATERVTLTTALPQIPAANTVITRLHYVRFAQDEEEMQFDSENVAPINLTAVELPLEYTNAVTGLQPIYLYHLRAAGPVLMDWYYTAFAASVVSNNKLFTAYPMIHKAIKHSADGNSNQVDIEARPDDSHPFSMLASLPGKVIWVDILLCYLPAPDATTKIFSGFVSTVTDDIIKYTANCDTRLRWLRTKLPRYLIGSTCNHILYNPATCGVGRAWFETTVNLVSIDNADLPPTVVCTFAIGPNSNQFQATDYLLNGIFEAGFGKNYEIRSIIGSNYNAGLGQLTLTLNAPLKRTLAGAQAQIVAGCDHTSTTCANKFNNFNNFGGFVDVPDRNLSLKGINTNVSAGGKGK